MPHPLLFQPNTSFFNVTLIMGDNIKSSVFHQLRCKSANTVFETYAPLNSVLASILFDAIHARIDARTQEAPRLAHAFWDDTLQLAVKCKRQSDMNAVLATLKQILTKFDSRQTLTTLKTIYKDVYSMHYKQLVQQRTDAGLQEHFEGALRLFLKKLVVVYALPRAMNADEQSGRADATTDYKCMRNHKALIEHLDQYRDARAVEVDQLTIKPLPLVQHKFKFAEKYANGAHHIAHMLQKVGVEVYYQPQKCVINIYLFDNTRYDLIKQSVADLLKRFSKAKNALGAGTEQQKQKKDHTQLMLWMDDAELPFSVLRALFQKRNYLRQHVIDADTVLQSFRDMLPSYRFTAAAVSK